MKKIGAEIKTFVDQQLTAPKAINYDALIKLIAKKYGLRVSKATISKQAKSLNLRLSRGRRRIVPLGQRPSHSLFLDCAGAFFLKGAELETGVLAAMNRLLVANTDSLKAQRALELAQQINALLVYAPIFGLHTPAEIAAYPGRGLLYLAGQKTLPSQDEISQYLQFLSEQKLLLPIIKEVVKMASEALTVRIDFAKQTFYLDAQGHTVWAKENIPRSFSTTLNKTIGYIKNTFLSPAPQRPLILQVSPGYTVLPPEVFALMQCCEQAQQAGIDRILVTGKFGEKLAFWQDLKPPSKCFFLAPLSSWQYAHLQGTQIVHDFRQYHLGPSLEAMAVADADILLFNPQLNKNIMVRAALVRRKNERLGLVTNISRREERYINRVAEAYFLRWPDETLKNYYDLLEEAHAQVLAHTPAQEPLTNFFTVGYAQKPENVFKLFLEHLHRYAAEHFFPSEYANESLDSMAEKIYQQNGYVKTRRALREIILRPFSLKKLQEDVKLASQKFNQSGLEFPDQKKFHIYL